MFIKNEIRIIAKLTLADTVICVTPSVRLCISTEPYSGLMNCGNNAM